MTTAKLRLHCILKRQKLGGLSMSMLINQFVSPTFCLCFAFTGINFRGMLDHVCDVAYDENMCERIRTGKCRSTF